jgi:hypothetical protein
LVFFAARPADGLPIRGGDGGEQATVADLCSFWRNLFSNRILSPELTAVFLQTHERFNEKTGYGCGLYKRLDGSLFSIIGGGARVGFDSRYFVGQKISASILSNITNGEEDLRQVVMDSFDKMA